MRQMVASPIAGPGVVNSIPARPMLSCRLVIPLFPLIQEGVFSAQWVEFCTTKWLLPQSQTGGPKLLDSCICVKLVAASDISFADLTLVSSLYELYETK